MSLADLTFAWPWAFALMPLVLGLSWWSGRPRRRGSVAYSSVDLVRPLRTTLRRRLAWMPGFMRAVALLALVGALARPQFGIGEVRTTADSIAIMMVVDRSGSMDLPMRYAGNTKSRLSVVKDVLREFVEGNDNDLDGRPQDLIGLVSFAGFAGTVCPLVRIHTTLVDLADALELARDGLEDGTAIGDGVALAAARLKDAEDDLARRNQNDPDPDFTIKSKVIVLLTDGDENRGDIAAEQAAQLCAEWGIKIYAIGIGDERGGLINTQRGRQRIFPGQGFNEAKLVNLARTTGGRYWRAGSGESLREIYGAIDELEKTEIRSIEHTSYEEAFANPAMLGAGLLGVELLLSLTLLRRLP